MSYAYYIPMNYSLASFKHKNLDYIFQKKSREIEIWGNPKNVSAYLDSSNIIMHQIAITMGESYFDMNLEIGSTHTYFADICHFSYQGLSKFSTSLAQQIQKIKYL